MRNKPSHRKPKILSQDPVWIEGWSAVSEYLRNKKSSVTKIQLKQGAIPVGSDIEQTVKKLENSKAVEIERVSASEWGGSKSIARCYVVHKVLNEKQFDFDKSSLVLVLDGIEDPRNFGAIARSAAFLGVKDLVFREKRQVSLTSSALATAQGAFAYMNLVEVKNISRFLDQAKNNGFWVLGAEMHGEPCRQVAKKFASDRKVLVLGNEGNGLSKLVKDHCDVFVSIPSKASLDSLNVSAAASILLYEFST